MLGVAQPFGLATPPFIIEPFLCLRRFGFFPGQGKNLAAL